MADSTTDAANEAAAPGAMDDQSIARLLDEICPIPVPVVREPKILPADPELAQQGKQLQKFNEDAWRQVRYADTKRQFESTTPFCALKVNEYLESLIPKCKAFEVLQRMDQTLAAVTHGLLKQKKLLDDALDSLPAAVKDAAVNAFTSPESEYKKISDDLLQYVMGRRAQVIQQRREMFMPWNLGVRQALYAIPPSNTHLFAEPRLTELVEALPDRVDHFAPNTSKCKCCHVHKQRRFRHHSESEEDDLPSRKRRHN